MSQIIRATDRSPELHGSTRKDDGSGIAIMSDSSIALKPVTDEPSKPIPCMTASSSSRWVMAKLFSRPTRSVNHSWTKVMSSSFTRLITSARRSSAAVGIVSISLLSPFPGMKKAPGRTAQVLARGSVASRVPPPSAGRGSLPGGL